MLRRQAARGALAPQSTFRITRTFCQDDTESFGALTRDYNPVHYEQRWVAHKGMRAPICHGLLVGSMLCEVGGQLGWLASGMSFRFRRPVYFGDTVTCELTIRSIDARFCATADCVLTNQQGEVVVTAMLEGYLPDRDEQALLQAMMDEGDPTNGARR